MGEVWRAWDHRLKTHRAIKLLSPAMAQHPQVLRRFEREAQAMARLDHPNIVTVHDLVLEEHPPFIVMEMLRGGSLEDWLERHGVMPPALALRVMAAVLEALQAAHAQGVIHRDVKPANVLLTERGVPKVTDFGIAHLVDSSRTITRAGPMGTQAFMPPEQQVDPGRVDGRADVYAAATTMLRLLTGRWPVNAHASVFEDVLFSGIDPALLPVLRQATAADPDDRPPTAAALQEKLALARDSVPEVPEGATLVPHRDTLLEIGPPPSPAPVAAAATTPPPETSLDGSDAPLRLPWTQLGLVTAVGIGLAVVLWPGTGEDQGAPPGEPGSGRLTPPEGPEEPEPAPQPADQAADLETPELPPATPPTARTQPVRAPKAAAAQPDPEPDPEPEAAAEPEPEPEPEGTAPLTLNAIPFAQVRLDGTALGETPRTVVVASGTHRVEFRSADGAIVLERQVTVTADTPQTLCVDLERDAPCQG